MSSISAQRSSLSSSSSEGGCQRAVRTTRNKRPFYNEPYFSSDTEDEMMAKEVARKRARKLSNRLRAHKVPTTSMAQRALYARRLTEAVTEVSREGDGVCQATESFNGHQVKNAVTEAAPEMPVFSFEVHRPTAAEIALAEQETDSEDEHDKDFGQSLFYQ